MHLLIAPDSFKGTATSLEVATALAAGWLDVRSDDTVELVPMADGGEGTLDAFEAAFPGSRRNPVTVTGPAGTAVDTYWLTLPDGRAVVELASTSGITLLSTLEPDRAQTRGLGEALSAALDTQPKALVVAIGGSSSTDAGLGLLSALGARFRDSAGRPVQIQGAGIDSIETVDLSSLRPVPPDGVTVITDVISPLLGATGAARVFGPQKGVTADRLEIHETRMQRMAELLPQVDPDTPGAGAAGGAGFGLLVWGAVLTPGAEAVAAALRLDERMAGADMVITGEGRFDGQSQAGKVPVHVAAAAGAKPVILVAGSIEADTTNFLTSVDLCQLPGGRAEAFHHTTIALHRAGATAAATVDERLRAAHLA